MASQPSHCLLFSAVEHGAVSLPQLSFLCKIFGVNHSNFSVIFSLLSYVLLILICYFVNLMIDGFVN